MARTNTAIRLSVVIHWNGYDLYRWLVMESDALVIWAMAEYIVMISTGDFCHSKMVCIPFLIETWHSCVLENTIKSCTDYSSSRMLDKYRHPQLLDVPLMIIPLGFLTLKLIVQVLNAFQCFSIMIVPTNFPWPKFLYLPCSIWIVSWIPMVPFLLVISVLSFFWS